MLKHEELSNPDSCLSRAKNDEMCFVLLGRDVAAPAAIRAWIDARIKLGKNTPEDATIRDAEDCVTSIIRYLAKQSAQPAPATREHLVTKVRDETGMPLKYAEASVDCLHPELKPKPAPVEAKTTGQTINEIEADGVVHLMLCGNNRINNQDVEQNKTVFDAVVKLLAARDAAHQAELIKLRKRCVNVVNYFNEYFPCAKNEHYIEIMDAIRALPLTTEAP